MRRAMTLMELLVVLAVIAALAAFAWPVVRGSLARAKTTKCLSNLRLIGFGLQMYLADNNMVFPELEAARRSLEEEVATIDTVLHSYVGDKAAFACPADEEQHVRTGTSYFWNSVLNGQSVASLNLFGKITDLSRIPVLTDKEGWHRHARRSANHLFADGHVSDELRLFAE